MCGNMKYGDISLETVFSPDTNSAVIVLKNDISGRIYVKYEVQGIDNAQKVQSEINATMIDSGCSACSAQKIDILLDLPEKVRNSMKVIS